MDSMWLDWYLSISALALAGVLALRRVGKTVPPTTGRLEGPYDAAVVHAGPDLAVLAAVAALRAEGQVQSVDDRVQAVDTPAGSRHRLERLVHACLATPVAMSELATVDGVAAELEAISERLDAGGFLADTEPVAVARYGPWALLGMAAVGFGGALGGAGGRPLDLATSTMIAVCGALVTVPPGPRPNRAGRAALARLRREHPLSRQLAEAHSADETAMAVALYGEIAFEKIDPTFAAATWPWTSSGRHRRPQSR